MKVIVNPNYRGNGWFDTAAKVSFVKREEPYEIPEGINDVHIKKHLALGYLLEVKPKEELQSETLQPIVASSYKEVLDEEVKVEKVQEELVETKEEVTYDDEPTAEVQAEEVIEAEVKTEEKPKRKRATKKKQSDEVQVD